MSFTFGTVFLAGVLSFFTPCVLPMLPAYSTLLFGSADQPKTFSQALLNVASFLLAFCLVFVAMGATAGLLSDFFWDFQDLIRQVGAVFMIIMGLYMTGIFNISALNYEKRPLLNQTFNGPFGAFMFGLGLTAGWTPCSGPILAGVLIYASTLETASAGAWLLLVYALGFCVPFLALSVITKRYALSLRNGYRYLPILQKLSGGIIVLLGILLFLDKIKLLNMFIS